MGFRGRYASLTLISMPDATAWTMLYGTRFRNPTKSSPYETTIAMVSSLWSHLMELIQYNKFVCPDGDELISCFITTLFVLMSKFIFIFFLSFPYLTNFKLFLITLPSLTAKNLSLSEVALAMDSLFILSVPCT
jgi:hypothetical protein